MIIKVDKEAKNLITDLCDAALKLGGITNMKPVLYVLNNVEDINVDITEANKKEPTEEIKKTPAGDTNG